jgi:hypothetical protein
MLGRIVWPVSASTPPELSVFFINLRVINIDFGAGASSLPVLGSNW